MAFTKTFVDASIAGPSGPITARDLDYGDGSPHGSGTGPWTHNYAAAGTYEATLTVTGTSPDGTDSATLAVSVGGAPSGTYATEVAALTYNPRAGAGADEFAALDAAGVIAAGGRHVVCTSRAQHDAAITDLRAKDWVDCQGIAFSGQVNYKKSLTGWAKITYNSACSFTGVPSGNFPAIYINPANYIMFLISCPVTNRNGGAGVLVHKANHFVLDFSTVHDVGATGVATLPASDGGDIQNFFVRGEVHNIGLNKSYDPHSEKGTGQHCCITSDARGGCLHHGLFAIYGHDCGAGNLTGGGSVLEMGLAPGTPAPAAPAHDIDIYLKGHAMLFEALHQTGGNGINFWGDLGPNITVHVIEVDDMAGHGVNSDDGAAGGGTRKSGTNVLAGTASSVCQNPRYSGDNPWQEGGGITYGTMTPAAP